MGYAFIFRRLARQTEISQCFHFCGDYMHNSMAYLYFSQDFLANGGIGRVDQGL
jgi:hypothetical protein